MIQPFPARTILLALALAGMLLPVGPRDAAAQSRSDGCELVLWKAQRQYANSRFRDVIAQFGTCPPANIADEKERIEAYKLLALSWIGEERPEQAAQYALAIRELDPLYQPDETEFSRYYLELFPTPDAQREIDAAVQAREQALLLAAAQTERAEEAEQVAVIASAEAARNDSLARMMRGRADSLQVLARLAIEEQRAAEDSAAQALARAASAIAAADSAEVAAREAQEELDEANRQLIEAQNAKITADRALQDAIARAEQAEQRAQAEQERARNMERKVVTRRRAILGFAAGAGIVGAVVTWLVKPSDKESLPTPPPFPSPTN